MSDLRSSSPPKADEPLTQEFSLLISGIQHYLMQERDLFGNIIYPSVEAGAHQKGLKEEASGNYPAEPWANTASLGELNSRICECQKCSLGATRTKFVFGVGNPKAEIVLIGEAPGADEDLKGEPFVGRAGQLLNKILEAIHFKREDV
jgi:Uracil-DNA glycosylase